jgi:GNAT superfamily N-acetyltransferase
MALVVRRIRPGDERVAAQLEGLLDEGTHWDSKQGRRFLAEDKTNALFLAEVNGMGIGFATANRLQRLDARQAEVLLYEIAVRGEYQRQGVGRALIAEVLNWAREVGADEVWVLADSDNTRACAFYAATGGEQFIPNSTMFTYRVTETHG